MKNNPGIASLILNVTYDSTLLTLTGVEYNPSIGGQSILPSNKTSPLTLYWINAFSNLGEDVVFATLTFKVSETATAGDISPVVISYDPDNVYNLNEENVEFALSSGIV